MNEAGPNNDVPGPSSLDDSMMEMVIQNFNEILSVPFLEDNKASASVDAKQSPDVTDKDRSSAQRLEDIERAIQSLVHTCQCRDSLCQHRSCHKLKRVIEHTKKCKKRVTASCPVCRQLIALCCWHAKHCGNTRNCAVPFCENIREKIEERRQMKGRSSDASEHA